MVDINNIQFQGGPLSLAGVFLTSNTCNIQSRIICLMACSAAVGSCPHPGPFCCSREGARCRPEVWINLLQLQDGDLMSISPLSQFTPAEGPQEGLCRCRGGSAPCPKHRPILALPHRVPVSVPTLKSWGGHGNGPVWAGGEPGGSFSG